jgi:hypothetical protein
MSNENENIIFFPFSVIWGFSCFPIICYALYVKVSQLGYTYYFFFEVIHSGPKDDKGWKMSTMAQTKVLLWKV